VYEFSHGLLRRVGFKLEIGDGRLFALDGIGTQTLVLTLTPALTASLHMFLFYSTHPTPCFSLSPLAPHITVPLERFVLNRLYRALLAVATPSHVLRVRLRVPLESLVAEAEIAAEAEAEKRARAKARARRHE
jgi:hypothetical protein